MPTVEFSNLDYAERQAILMLPNSNEPIGANGQLPYEALNKLVRSGWLEQTPGNRYYHQTDASREMWTRLQEMGASELKVKTAVKLTILAALDLNPEMWLYIRAIPATKEKDISYLLRVVKTLRENGFIITQGKGTDTQIRLHQAGTLKELRETMFREADTTTT